MIFNDNKIYAKVWKVTPSENGKYIDLQITTSEKDNDGNYVNSSWFPRVIGKAVNTLKGLKRRSHHHLKVEVHQRTQRHRRRQEVLLPLPHPRSRNRRQ